ncbi:TPA: CopY family transcriptional regulator [Candidatus Falkowbacteria bacterium]|nr:CopY family transcriptional regulator [Candidatus Falkowbacteria bacterium]
MINKKVNFLGKLEAEIMEIVWTNGTVSVRDVVSELEKRKKIAYTTVMTVMTRLFKKNILKRKQDKGGAFVYLPTKEKKEFVAQASEKMIRNFLQEFGDVAVAQFVDVIEMADAEHSASWKKKLKDLLE